MIEEIIIGENRPDKFAVSSWADNLTEEITLVLAEHKTAELEQIADYREEIRSDGWMQQMIREYLEIWR